jgi:hypothetical protein
MSGEEVTLMNHEDAGHVLRETLDLRGRVARNPYGMMAGALGVGFVLGGGLFTRLTARIVGAGLRMALMAALPALQETLLEVVTGSKLDINKGD